MTDGCLRADGSWQRLGYVPDDLLQRLWQTHVLELIATRLVGDVQAQARIDEMRRRYPKGFVAHLQGNVLPRMQQLRAQLMKAPHVAVQQVMDVGVVPLMRPRYRERMRSAFGHDPLVCPHCGGAMWLWQVWHPQYGMVYDELERMKQGGYERVERPMCRPIDPDRAGDAGVGSDGGLQLPLFPLPT